MLLVELKGPVMLRCECGNVWISWVGPVESACYCPQCRQPAVLYRQPREDWRKVWEVLQ
jgi:hypothetical protein